MNSYEEALEECLKVLTDLPNNSSSSTSTNLENYLKDLDTFTINKIIERGEVCKSYLLSHAKDQKAEPSSSLSKKQSNI